MSNASMPRPLSFRALFRLLTALLFLVLAPASAIAARGWPALDPAELADRKPRVDPEAGAEILLRQVEMDDVDDVVTAIEYFIRIKIYSERSLEKLSKIEVFYNRSEEIRAIAARTHRPDGTVLELTRKDIFDRDVLKTGDYRQKVKSFAPPGLQVGAIVEYRYTRIIYDGINALPLSFQENLPTRFVRFRLRPYQYPNLTARIVSFAYPPGIPKPNQDGFYQFEMRDVPARVDEPWRPPAIQTDPTVLLYYSDYRGDDPVRHWNKRATELFNESDRETKPSKAVRATVEPLLTANDSAADKLRKLYDYCRSRIKHRDLESSGFTEEQRAKLKPNGSPEATLKAGHGTSRDITMLFVAMARAAGFDARYAWCNDSSAFAYHPKMTERFALSDLVAAVKVDGTWKYYDPARIYVPPAMLSWENAGTAILVGDKTAGKVDQTAVAPAEASRRIRTAALRLEQDGTLEGDVKIVYTGLWDAEMKHRYDGKTEKVLAELVADSLREFQPLAEVTNVKVLNPNNPLEFLQVSYHLRIPEYAERTGSRLFFQPGVFFKGTKPLFEAATRKYDIQLRYGYVSEERLSLTLPDGFELEAASAPAGFELPKIAQYKVEIGYQRENRLLQYHRVFSSSIITVPVKHYSTFKAIFDTMHVRDNHALTLKRASSTTDSVASDGDGAR